MTPTPPHPSACPACAAPVEGRFCAQCGTPVDGAACAGCRAALSPGARFCHRCGTAAGAQPARAAAAVGGGPASALPWAFAAIVLLAFGAYVAAQHFASQRAPEVASAPGAMPPGGAPFAGGAGLPGQTGPAPDISNMSPEERADRLFDRIMTAYEQGNSEYVQNMAPMALAAYDMLPTLDPLRRFDLGRIAEVTGSLQVAQAHADTLLAANPQHLLGLVLASRVADLEQDEARRAALAQRLIEAAPAELDQGRPEYAVHANTINIALTEARRRAR